MIRGSPLRLLVFAPCLLLAADATVEEARREIVAAYQRSLDALRRGDADTALQIDTADWVSITVGQQPRTRQEMEPLIRRDIAGMKPPPDWNAVWGPGYERNGTSSGIQVYEVKVEGDQAVVLCLVGGSSTETAGGRPRTVWRGSHVRDTWVRTADGWKRRLHEKLTVNEQMVDGRPAFDAFEVATVKLTPPEWRGRFFRMESANQFVARGYTLRVLISAAYRLNPKAVSGGPAWIDADRYDVVARTPGAARPSLSEQLAMLRELLASRFNLSFHREKKEMSIYELTIAKNGPKIQPSQAPVTNPEGPPPLVFVLAPDVVRVNAQSATTAELADILQRAAFDRPVLDRTGLAFQSDFTLEFSPDESLFGGALRGGDGTKPGLFAAIQEQLGLKLEATKGPVDTIVIDKVERPSEN